MVRSLLASACLVLLASAPANAQQWAEKMLDVKKHDFGTVARGADVVFKFPIKNLYEENFEILSVRSSCGCTTATIDNSKRVLRTGEVGHVVARFNTLTHSGSRSATLTTTLAYTSKEGARRIGEVRLRVFGTIRSDIDFRPGSVKFGSVDQGAVNEQQVTVSYRGGRPNWQIVNVMAGKQIDYVEAELMPPNRQWGRVTYSLRIRLKENAPAGYIKDRLVLVTNDHGNVRIPLEIEGRVVPEISVSPQKLVIGEISNDKQVTKRLIVKGKKPFKITGVECEGGGCFSFQAGSDSKPLHLIEVTFDACKVPTGRVRKAIHISTDRGENIGAQLTFYATVVPGEKPGVEDDGESTSAEGESESSGDGEPANSAG